MELEQIELSALLLSSIQQYGSLPYIAAFQQPASCYMTLLLEQMGHTLFGFPSSVWLLSIIQTADP